MKADFFHDEGLGCCRALCCRLHLAAFISHAQNIEPFGVGLNSNSDGDFSNLLINIDLVYYHFSFIIQHFPHWLQMSFHSFNYIGPSMYPTLRAGDGLMVVPYENRKIKRGDLVVFRSPSDGQQIVHRVIAITENGIQTRGDNNRLPDPYWLQQNDIIGQVVEVRRGKRRIKKFNGFMGLGVAEYRRNKSRLWRFLYRLVSVPYQKIAPLRLPLIKREKLKIVVFHKDGGEQQVLMFGRRLIGRRLSPEQPWIIRAPYRYFISEKFGTLNENRK